MPTELLPVQRKSVALMVEYDPGISNSFNSWTFLQTIALTVFAHIDKDESLFRLSGIDMDIDMQR